MDTELLNRRISQWEKMTSDDPDNAMGWFSLGSAYKEAGREQDAARCLRKAIELDENLSRAYQLLAQVLISCGADGPALEVLCKGYPVAASRGDTMPLRAMESLFKKLGHEPPKVEMPAGPTAEPPTGDTVVDRRTGQSGPRLPNPPMRGPLGRYIQDHYSATTWRQWISQGTKVINELRLDFSRLDHQDIYDLHMMEWLGFTREEAEEYARQHE
jgi:Fe-S cluster biosynthesis and repair protein YggX